MATWSYYYGIYIVPDLPLPGAQSNTAPLPSLGHSDWVTCRLRQLGVIAGVFPSLHFPTIQFLTERPISWNFSPANRDQLPHLHDNISLTQSPSPKMSSPALNKIAPNSPSRQNPSELETSIAGALYELETNTADLKVALRPLQFVSAREVR